MNNKTLLKVRNVKKYFHTSGGVLKAIDDISFDVKQGEIVGLIGESGSGKTTVGRCLIRLYEQYSGFVSLDGQAISGSKLSKKKKIFLNQNMQMIFQDPHASLNGQQNIYTILKEPLVVNKIMKNEYDDFFMDWEEVKDNFKFTFSEELKKIELDTITYHAKEAEKFYKEWVNIFNRIKFTYEDIDNDFNQYFAFKLSNQEREGNVISNIFRGNSKILDLYFNSQKEFRNDSILLIEQELKKKKSIYEKSVLESKMTDFDLRKRRLLSIKKKELKRLIESKENASLNHSNIIDSYVKEFRNTYQFYLESAKSKSNYEEFNVQIKFYLVFKKMHSVLKKHRKEIIYLSSEKLDFLISDLKKYGEQFLANLEMMININSKTYQKEMKKIVNSNFSFDFSEYLELSSNKESDLIQKITKLKKEIGIINWTFSKDKSTPSKTSEDVEKAKNDYLKLKEVYDKESEEYSVSYSHRMADYESKISKEKNKLNLLRDEIEKLNSEFDQKHKEFLSGLEKHLIDKGESKEKIKNIITIYDNKVKLKNETLESFNVEITNLNKDLRKLKCLLGVEKSIHAKKHIKKILMNEKIYKALEDVGLLRQFAWRYPHEFSGGQRQRIVIARALISNPKIIIADEPIASLDVSIQAQVVNILKELCEKKNVSLIFIAHDLSMVEYIADKILIMHLGKIVEFGKTEEIYSRPIHPYTVNLFNSIPKISNANDKFESSNFELDYLEEQEKAENHIDFYALNDEHVIYSTVSQFREWTNEEPKECEFTKNVSSIN